MGIEVPECETDYFAKAPRSWADIMALPVANRSDLEADVAVGAWTHEGEGWEPRRTRLGWVRLRIETGRV